MTNEGYNVNALHMRGKGGITMTINETRREICKTLEIYSDSSFYEIIRELQFLENREKFYYSECVVSGGIRILCSDFGIEVSSLLSERRALEDLLDELTRIVNQNEKRAYGLKSEVWTPGRFYDLRNTVKEVIRIFGEEDFSSDLSRDDRRAIFELLEETPANREHWSF